MDMKVIMIPVISAIEFEVEVALTTLISLKNIIINHNTYIISPHIK